MKANLICGLAVACLAIYSCNQNELKEENSKQDMVVADTDKSMNDQSPVQEPFHGPVQYDSTPPVKKTAPIIDWNKKIIKNATVKVEVKHLEKYNAGLHEKIQKHGGYIAHEDNFFTEYKRESVISIKVPVAQFEDLINDLGGKDIKVVERSIRSEEVTGQVADTRARLEAKKHMRLKYLEFLKQSKNMTEVLQVQEEINGIQEEIEAAAGRLGYLSNQSAFSTIHLTYYEPLTAFTTPEMKPGFFAKALAAFKTGTDVIKTLILGLITIWPLLLVLLVVIYFWRKKANIKVMQAKA